MNEKVYDDDRNELITLQEAEELGYGKESTLKMRIHAGNLKAIKKGYFWLIRKDDVKKQSKIKE